MGILYSFFLEITVEPPLKATSTQRPLYFVPADSPHIYSYLNPSTTATATNACPNYRNNFRQRPVFSATDEKVKNGHELNHKARLWSIAAILFWFFFHLYFTCVSTILVKFEIYFLGSHKNFSLVLLQITKFIYSPWKVKKKMRYGLKYSGKRFLSTDT